MYNLLLHMFRHLYELIAEGADVAECDYLVTADNDADFTETDCTITEYTTEEAMSGHIREEVFCQVIWNKLYRRELAEGVESGLERHGSR